VDGVNIHRLFIAPDILEKLWKGIHNLPMARPRRPIKKSPVKQFFYALRYRIGEYALRGFVAALPWIPYRLLVLITDFWARVTFGLLWKYRARMNENVAMALGKAVEEPSARKALIWRAWKNFALGVLETCAVMHFAKEKIISTIALEGEEHLKEALARGKGVLALSAHLGSFTMIGARLGAQGYPFSAVVKQPKESRFARLIDDYRAQLGIHTISAKPRKDAVRGILKALRQNRIVLVIADEFKSGGVPVNFMGQTSAAPRGPATLALRTGAVTVPMFATRRGDGSLKLSIGAEIKPVLAEDDEASVAATTVLYTRHLEEAILRFPDQWNWLGFPRADRVSREELARRRALREGRPAPASRAARKARFAKDLNAKSLDNG
jgi:KDO2-lipid IV(A) lauroyltransferase